MTPRVQSVLVLVAAGKSNAEIAAELCIQLDTVKSHVRRALQQLGARNRAHAVAIAMTRGEIQPAAEEVGEPREERSF